METETSISPAGNAGQGGHALAKEWAYYTDNRDEIVRKHCGKYVVISGERVIAAYDTRKAAYHDTAQSLPPGSFMIHHATEVEEVIQLSPFSYA
ncbi:MAG: DUF5678 domain-containing protein [Spirochaetaceae bacterium]|jgi:hypothetical protein|nr:DUF5678 domain-containing protein [Spirochaetaceae bacterium]